MPESPLNYTDTTTPRLKLSKKKKDFFCKTRIAQSVNVTRIILKFECFFNILFEFMS